MLLGCFFRALPLASSFSIGFVSTKERTNGVASSHGPVHHPRRHHRVIVSSSPVSLFATASNEKEEEEEKPTVSKARRKRKATTTPKKRKATTSTTTDDKDNDVQKKKQTLPTLQKLSKFLDQELSSSSSARAALDATTVADMMVDPNALTKRLQQATANAKAAAIEADYANKKQQYRDSFSSNDDDIDKRRGAGSSSSGSATTTTSSNMKPNKEDDTHLGTLQQLTKIIDRELLSASDGTATFNIRGTTNPPPGITRDSMRSLLQENEAQQLKKERVRNRQQKQQSQYTFTLGPALVDDDDDNYNASSRHDSHHMVRHIGIVISKPLVQDQVTLEYASRLRTLAKAIAEGQSPPNTRKNERNDVNNETVPGEIHGSTTSTTRMDTTEVDKESETTNSSTGNNIGNNTNYLDDDNDLDNHYKPSMIYFLGGIAKGNLVADADAGYIFFKHLCAAHNISLEGIEIMLEKTTLGKGALQHIMRQLRKDYIPKWKIQKESVNNRQDTDARSINQQPQKVQLHVTFFSCDYDLCRLNDIHYRSPRQSILRPLLETQDDDGSGDNDNNNYDEDGDGDDYDVRPTSAGGKTASNKGGPVPQDNPVEISWSYRFSSYPYRHFRDPMTSFLGKCFLLAEELTPVLVNIRGVVDGVSIEYRPLYLSLSPFFWQLLIPTQFSLLNSAM